MRQIYVLLTKYSDWISTVVYHVGGRGFTHSSISLEEDPNTYTASTSADLRWRPWKSTAAAA